MAKFCGKCGSELDNITGLCSNCGARKMKKKKKRTAGQKVRRFLLRIVLIIVVVGSVAGGLLYFGVIDLPFLPDSNKDDFNAVNEKTIIVEEKDVVMSSDTKGIATIIVHIPNYEQLFKDASTYDNPDDYLLKALSSGKYEVLKFEKKADVTIDNGVTTIHSNEVVHQLLEESLINAINAQSEVK